MCAPSPGGAHTPRARGPRTAWRGPPRALLRRPKADVSVHPCFPDTHSQKGHARVPARLGVHHLPRPRLLQPGEAEPPRPPPLLLLGPLRHPLPPLGPLRQHRQRRLRRGLARGTEPAHRPVRPERRQPRERPRPDRGVREGLEGPQDGRRPPEPRQPHEDARYCETAPHEPHHPGQVPGQRARPAQPAPVSLPEPGVRVPDQSRPQRHPAPGPPRARRPQGGTGDMDGAAPGSGPAATLASALSHLHRRSNTTYRTLGLEVGVDPSYISRAISGERIPPGPSPAGSPWPWPPTRKRSCPCGGPPAATTPPPVPPTSRPHCADCVPPPPAPTPTCS